MQFMNKVGEQFMLSKFKQRCTMVSKACARIGAVVLVVVFFILLGGTWLLAMGRPWISCRSGSWDEPTYKYVKAVTLWRNGHWGVEYLGPTAGLTAFGTIAFAVVA